MPNDNKITIEIQLNDCEFDDFINLAKIIATQEEIKSGLSKRATLTMENGKCVNCMIVDTESTTVKDGSSKRKKKITKYTVVEI